MDGGGQCEWMEGVNVSGWRGQCELMEDLGCKFTIVFSYVSAACCIA